MTDWEGHVWHGCSSVACWISWADHWQTSIAGVLAVGAAAVAVTIEGRRAGKQKAAKLRAARASLAGTLSAVCAYAASAGRELGRVYPDGDGILDTADEAPKLHPFPADRVSSLERVVELVGTRDDVADRIESILREAQVLDARADSFLLEGEADRAMLGSCIIQAATIYALAESLFEYARGQLAGVTNDPPLWTRVFAAMNIFGLHAAKFEQVRALADRQRKRGDAPGEAGEPAPW